MKEILITGGAGYIGSHTCKALAGAGYVPIVLDVAAAMGANPAVQISALIMKHDGTAVRDCIHVSDLANAHVSAIEHLLAEVRARASIWESVAGIRSETPFLVWKRLAVDLSRL